METDLVKAIGRLLKAMGEPEEASDDTTSAWLALKAPLADENDSRPISYPAAPAASQSAAATSVRSSEVSLPDERASSASHAFEERLLATVRAALMPRGDSLLTPLATPHEAAFPFEEQTTGSDFANDWFGRKPV